MLCFAVPLLNAELQRLLEQASRERDRDPGKFLRLLRRIDELTGTRDLPPALNKKLKPHEIRCTQK
jgi:hypothetical protein